MFDFSLPVEERLLREEEERKQKEEQERLEREERARLKAEEDTRFAVETGELGEILSTHLSVLEKWRVDLKKKREVSSAHSLKT